MLLSVTGRVSHRQRGVTLLRVAWQQPAYHRTITFFRVPRVNVRIPARLFLTVWSMAH